MRICCAILLALLLAACPAPDSSVVADGQAPVFFVQLRDGGLFQVATTDRPFQWKTVASDGTITSSVINVSDIASLRFAKSPASEEVARIRSLINDLASDDYHHRNAAERTLQAEGKPFETVIRQAQKHGEPEVRYRVERILEVLGDIQDNQANRSSLEFDILEMKDGRRLEGDVGDLTLACRWNNVNVEVKRSNCHRVLEQAPFDAGGSGSGESESVKTRLVVDPARFFGDEGVREGLVQVDFDSTGTGDPTVSDRAFSVENLFAHLGSRFFCETLEGRVVISGFKFRHSRSRRNSIGNFYIQPASNGKTEKKISYKGVTRIDFCVPGNPGVPATTQQLGMFVEIVVPGHTIVEACNASGHVVGLTQSARDRYSFIGIESNSPISYVRVLANRYLVVDKLNPDFAIDDLTYSPPVPAPDVNYSDGDQRNYIIVTARNERLLAQSVTFDAATESLDVVSATAGVADYRLPLADVRWLTGPQSREFPTREEEGVFVMLQDGSVVFCQFQQKLVAAANPALEISPENVIGVWGGGSVARYPQADDFEHGQVVLVRPLNRVVFDSAEFDWSDGKFSYRLNAAKNIGQHMLTGKAKPSDEDFQPLLVTAATPANLGLGEEEEDPQGMPLATAPSIWKSLPPVRPQGSGLLRTSDGQEFVLGGAAGFEFASAEGTTVTIRKNGQELSFDLSDVYTLHLPR